MRRKRGVSTAVATGTQRLEFVRIVCHPMSSTKPELHAAGPSSAPLATSAWTPPAAAMQTLVSRNAQCALPGL